MDFSEFWNLYTKNQGYLDTHIFRQTGVVCTRTPPNTSEERAAYNVRLLKFHVMFTLILVAYPT